ncbi:MAG: D-alanine--D-alanine ligase [Candidatus Symbiothrix sp.]|jgi:D-alanine-D-alanine ligase|nr:D-alanine--D-alanine ligase [Candidatus Symbiothrix sp.]
MSNKKIIAIVAGGYSSEMQVSLKSAEGICSFLDADRYKAYIVLIDREKWLVKIAENNLVPVDKNDFGFTDTAGQKVKFDYAYITIHGTPGENGLLQGYFEMLQLPYSGCDVLTSALTFSKYVCNRYLNGYGVKTAASVLLRSNDYDAESLVTALGLPIFVKPNDGGSSCGTTKVRRAEDLSAAIDTAFAEGREVIVESFMRGTEVTCGCYRSGNGDLIVFPVTEVVSKNEFFDFDAKYNPQSVEEITPARISPELTAAVQHTTRQIYEWIHAKGIIRVDYILSSAGEIRMLEVNTTPGMTVTSFIPQQVRAAGLNMTDVLTDIIEHGNSR